MGKIKVGAVSYLNTKPLLFGIKRSAKLMQQTTLIETYPSKVAEMLLRDEIDAGLVPVSVISLLKEHYIISDYCIGADGDVASVCLFSEVPIEKVETVLLDYQSRTSVNLCRILLRDYWKITPVLKDLKEDFKLQIKGATAAVIIGDRALEQRKNSPFIYDLSGAWKAMTGLPFVFAAWVANKKLPDEYTRLFNEMNKEGISNLDLVLKETSCGYYDLETYYNHNISYTFTDGKLKGMQLFLSMLAAMYI